MNAWARCGACHRAALCADPLAPLPTLGLLSCDAGLLKFKASHVTRDGEVHFFARNC
jgi:hypothetical protein